MLRQMMIVLVTLAVLPRAAGAQSTEQVFYYDTDAIGSVRAVTDASGTVSHYDFTPFGEPWSVPSTTGTRQFAGKERDANSGLDYFGARYYASQTGRFTTVDPALDVEKALVEPQLWNRYAYVTNNPLRFLDPDGRQREAALDRDVYALLNKQITLDEYNARIQARGAGAAIGAIIAAGPTAWRFAVGCFLSPSCQSAVIDIVEGAGGAPPRIGPRGLPFTSGDVIAREFSTGAGTVSMLAEAVVEGKTLHLKDIAVYPKDTQTLQVGTKGVLELLQKLKAEARQLGFTELRITGLRFSGAKPGKEVTLLFDLGK